MSTYTKSISNIAWRHNQLDQVLEILVDQDFKYIEVAPLELYDNWTKINQEKCNLTLEKLASCGIQICSMQSVFFGKNLNIYENYEECVKHMLYVEQICSEINCDYVVFGAPKARKKPENMPDDHAIQVLDDFLSHFKKIKIGIEAVPEFYGTNLLNDYKEVNNFVQKSNNPNLRIHFDVGAAIATGFYDFEEFRKDLITNVHLSLKGLKPITGKEKYISWLRSLGILDSRFVSIEMKKTSISQIKRSIKVFGEK